MRISSPMLDVFVFVFVFVVYSSATLHCIASVPRTGPVLCLGFECTSRGE